MGKFRQRREAESNRHSLFTFQSHPESTPGSIDYDAEWHEENRKFLAKFISGLKEPRYVKPKEPKEPPVIDDPVLKAEYEKREATRIRVAEWRKKKLNNDQP